MRRGHSWKWAALAALLSWPAVAGAQVLFFTDTYQPSPAIRRCSPTGTGMVSMPLPASTFPEGLAYDAVNNRLYWVEAAWSGARIRVTNGGLAPGTTILSGLGSVRGIAVDGAGGWMYWTSSNQNFATINRAHLDGSNMQVLFSLAGFNPRQCALDLSAGKLYWADLWFDAWIRCNLDGSAGEYLQLPAGSKPYGIAIDPVRHTVWWSHYGTGELQNLAIPPSPELVVAAAADEPPATVESRSEALLADMRAKRALPAAAQTLVGGLDNITHLAVDPATGAVYFTQPSIFPGGSVRRVNADGTGLTTLPVVEFAFGGVAWSAASLLDVPGEPPAPPPARAEWALRAQNPARPGTTIEFSLPSDGDVTLDVIDAAGRRVATLAEGTHSAGTHRVTWTGQTGAGRAAPGVYMLRLEWSGRRLTRRLTYIQ